LPLFALRGDGASLSWQDEATLERYTVAHHVGLIHGVVVDRVADGQAASADLGPLADHLLGCWRDSLAAATADRALAEGAIELALRAWRLGVRLEQTTLRRGRMRPERYVQGASLKLAWLSVAAECLLHARGERDALPHFRRAYHLLLLSLQCLDDAVDAEEDAALYGVSFPEAVGYPRESFARASARLARSAAAEAARGGFLRLAAWLEARAAEVDAIRFVTDSPRTSMGGLVVASALEAAWARQFARHRCATAATA
jgi:hypothetical protein